MKKKMIPLMAILAVIIAACGGSSSNTGQTSGTSEQTPAADANAAAASDETKGIGKFQDIKLADKLDAAKAETGEKVYDVKCGACHKTTTEKLVGPGWAGITSRRKPEWILNFVTNVDEMLDKDKLAKGMLEECMVRMPNQNLTDDDAYAVLEFMRKNDGVK